MWIAVAEDHQVATGIPCLAPALEGPEPEDSEQEENQAQESKEEEDQAREGKEEENQEQENHEHEMVQEHSHPCGSQADPL